VTVKRDILAALQGREPDSVLWNIHHLLLGRGTFEREMRNAGLGIVEKSLSAYQCVSPRVSVDVLDAWEKGARASYVTYRTPVGELSGKKRIGPDGSQWMVDYPVKERADLAILEFIVRDATYYPDYGALDQAQETLGEDGILLALLPRSPLQRLLAEWMGIEGVVFALAEHPAAMDRLLQSMTAADEVALEITAHSSAEVAWSPENITAPITSPGLFERYCAPYYNHFAQVLRSHGKLYGVHMDGKLAALKEAIADTQLDFVEGFTPPPMGDLPLEEAMSAWPSKAVWTNFPGNMLHLPDEEIIGYTVDLLETGMSAGRFLLTFSEDFPHTERSLRLVAEGIARYEGRQRALQQRNTAVVGGTPYP
jgi:hypothetical protein